jgi:NADPH2:quinone reductase
MQLVDAPVPEPQASDALAKVRFSGVNFIDTYLRDGHYRAELPFIKGEEGAGVVERVGAEVRDLKAGDAVVRRGVMGSYGEYAAVPAGEAGKNSRRAQSDAGRCGDAAGMTAHYLSHSTSALEAADTALVHPAAGGVGLPTEQMASQIGAQVIATVSTAEK